jgi:glycosyltransferase involved in cell wall biosynthesis
VSTPGVSTTSARDSLETAFIAAFLQKPTVSVVIPTLNEAKNLPHVLPRIPVWVDEVLLVDGHSTDGTVEVAYELCPAIRVIVTMDADGSTDPAEIPAFVGTLLAGADYAKGSRFLQGGGTADMPFYRRFGNWCFVQLVRCLFGGSYSDLCYGYNAIWKRVLPRLGLDCDGFEVETLINVRVLRAGLKIAEVPSFESARLHGRGYLRTIPDGWRVLKTIMREYLGRGHEGRIASSEMGAS